MEDRVGPPPAPSPCALDGLPSLVTALTLPLAVGAGYQIASFLIVTVEMAQITPPVRFSLFVIRALARLSLARVARLPGTTR